LKRQRGPLLRSILRDAQRGKNFIVAAFNGEDLVYVDWGIRAPLNPSEAHDLIPRRIRYDQVVLLELRQVYMSPASERRRDL